MGYLEQPHTSAGRIPSDLGYRFYVNRLQPGEPGQAERQALNKAAADGDALQNLLKDTVRTLSRITHLLGVATTVRDPSLAVKSAILSSVGPGQALFVLLLSNGQVENRIVECPPGMTLEDVGRVNEILQETANGKTLRSLARAKPPVEPGPAERLLSNVWSALKSISRNLTRGKLITDGEEFMFAQPEFRRDAHSLADLLSDLIEGDVLYEAISSSTENVTIGREHRQEELHQLSVVRRAFFVGDHEAGIIALVGPKRMAYESGIPLVNFTAKALSDSLTRFYG
jgi:heat-inducible transcriptional repressor